VQVLLDGITLPGGLRPQPSAEDLRTFVEATSGMDGLRMAELMMGKLVRPGPVVAVVTVVTLAVLAVVVVAAARLLVMVCSHTPSGADMAAGLHHH